MQGGTGFFGRFYLVIKSLRFGDSLLAIVRLQSIKMITSGSLFGGALYVGVQFVPPTNCDLFAKRLSNARLYTARKLHFLPAITYGTIAHVSEKPHRFLPFANSNTNNDIPLPKNVDESSEAIPDLSITLGDIELSKPLIWERIKNKMGVKSYRSLDDIEALVPGPVVKPQELIYVRTGETLEDVIDNNYLLE